VTKTYGFAVTIDSPTSAATITDGVTASRASNQHGEAGYAIWHHAIKTYLWCPATRTHGCMG
jgi:hypothetical protein